MPLTRFASLGIAFGMLSSTLAHMMLESPVPYGKSTLNNSPLEGTGLDYPCKLRAGVYDVTQMNYWTAGEAQTIRFIGSAVHGGGSCQFSVSEDLQPTRSSRWKVVHSVIGGCPASAEGNMSGGATSRVADTFEVVLPKELPSGRYSFAWTWFNKQGNREMYMNCAPITVRSGGSDASFLASLPDMFVANLPSSACSTIENFDYAFPDPGSAAVTGSQASPTTELVGGGCASMTALGRGSATTLPAELPSTSSTGQLDRYTVVQKRPVVASSETASTENIVETAGRALALAEMTTSEVTQSTNNIALHGTASTSGKVAGISAAPETCISCTSENQIVCIDKEHFGLCNLGCARPQPLATGTVCTNGQILRRNA
ncbi:lytic polysaccharide monooxygenase [Stemphylium lycopersici]|uniref:Lytic polysaccharide monooxygenase n=1 Tax=Stemphylium lycopersici TaxID=183478 RepID=A0A364MSJ0_STELY|nr:lytic polysaccharide monooxygenase [Stemphylium lycopersici]RAQ98813.1 lytic polysaccharide monooxygenase [Stemphylium lycopersici]RAR02102.1 lytic polysaccharide monooxygenase [Stemphylium lycopersici]